MKAGRILPLAAAALMLASLAFPFWTARMEAPAYPGQPLSLHMYAFKYQGDIVEWNIVGRLVGVHMPPPIPGVFFPLFSLSVVALCALAVAVGLTRRLARTAAVLPWVLMTAVMAWGQYSLYLFGHNLDPQRPLRYFDAFTPPVVGVLTLGKIKTYHYPDVGTFLFVLGAALLVFNAWRSAGAPRPRWFARKETAVVVREDRYATAR
ncbi:MAG: hypothetical protein HY681_06775 [Chloroflexi bacterium]|nr:hypothetical protein [Chloroflexota bacterium]